MADLPGCSHWTQAKFAINDNPAADPGAQGEKDHGQRGPFPVAEGQLTQRSRSDIVQQVYGVVDGGLQNLSYRDISPLSWEIREELGDAGSKIDKPRDSSSHSFRVRAAGFLHLLNEVSHPIEDRVRSLVGAGRS